MMLDTIRRVLSIGALVLLTSGVAHADLAPPDDGDKDGGGCLVGGAPLALAPLGVALVLGRRGRKR